MPAAAATRHLHPPHAVALVLLRLHLVITHRLPEAGPTGTGVILLLGPEELLPAPGARVHPGILQPVVLPGERLFRALLPQNPILLRREAGLPLALGLGEGIGHEESIEE